MNKRTLMELFAEIEDKVQKINSLKFIYYLILSAFVSSIITMQSCLLIFRA